MARRKAVARGITRRSWRCSDRNRVCPRGTPKWQEPITNFFRPIQQSLNENESVQPSTSATLLRAKTSVGAKGSKKQILKRCYRRKSVPKWQKPITNFLIVNESGPTDSNAETGQPSTSVTLPRGKVSVRAKGKKKQNSGRYSGMNRACPRKTPKWQKPITFFFKNKDAVSIIADVEDSDEFLSPSSVSTLSQNSIKIDEPDKPFTVNVISDNSSF